MDWILISPSTMPDPRRLVLGGWRKPASDEIALVRYIPAHGWSYHDDSPCPTVPNFWAHITPLPSLPVYENDLNALDKVLRGEEPESPKCAALDCTDKSRPTNLYPAGTATWMNLCGVCAPKYAMQRAE